MVLGVYNYSVYSFNLSVLSLDAGKLNPVLWRVDREV